MSPFPQISYQTKSELVSLIDFFLNNVGMHAGGAEQGVYDRIAALERKVAEQQSEIEAMQELVYKDLG